MNRNTDKTKEVLQAIQNLLRKIHQLNNTIQAIENSNSKETLSLEGIMKYKKQLTEDLVGLLEVFELNIKVDTIKT